MKKLIEDPRGGIPVRALGDKYYKYPEYAPLFFLR